ncbi:hypothetical protein CJ179_38940 [Rhodococcus sp. ACS1]|uniref:hypothetical protein n=1 Tax=Rhodococcus sp. ACS1 TaxID=2028570 RepID=UPI000BB1180C|nr:hypothetical protein [Rhodococcus sp. ACS1]PBC38574.1 hypothetical protein CJ179_38940 [Rhodococcus sp. ACS1]
MNVKEHARAVINETQRSGGTSGTGNADDILEALHKSGVVILTNERYADLLEDEDWLACLEAAGVDNWDGISAASDLRDEEG